MQLRDYQQHAVERVFEEWQQARSVCLVLQTGGGKTETAQAIIQRAGLRTMFTVHRKELLKQTFRRFSAFFGEGECGLVAAGHPPNPDARIQIAMLQTLVARELRPDAELIVHDEAHHIVSDEFRAVAEYYSRARWLGLTATPERADGQPLGDVFERLVVGSRYSQLIKGGYLVPCQVFHPPEDHDMGEGTALAQDPVAAYVRWAKGTQAIAFLPSVKLAYEHAQRFSDAGFPTACIEAETKASVRDEMIERFRAGDLRVLTNVNIMTEGLDLPAIETVILGRAFRHVTPYLQAVGRVLRPAPNKRHAICIDLVGARWSHGLPTEDRDYSLEGQGIRRSKNVPITTCQQCGAAYEATVRMCPVCGFERPLKTPKPPKIYSVELQETWAGEDTPNEAKEREWHRLQRVADGRGYGLAWAAREYGKLFGEKAPVDVDESAEQAEARKLVARAQEKGWSLGFVVKQYKDTFGKAPDLSWLGGDVRRAELNRLQATAQAKGYKSGWAAYQYKNIFGGWPPR